MEKIREISAKNTIIRLMYNFEDELYLMQVIRDGVVVKKKYNQIIEFANSDFEREVFNIL